MQRLEESKDFRPFKFRIQAFTNSFIEKLTSRDFTTEEVSGKLVSLVIALCSLFSELNLNLDTILFVDSTAYISLQ